MAHNIYILYKLYSHNGKFRLFVVETANYTYQWRDKVFNLNEKIIKLKLGLVKLYNWKLYKFLGKLDNNKLGIIEFYLVKYSIVLLITR